MRAEVTRGRTVKTVLVTEISDETDDEIVNFALGKASERMATLQDYRISRDTNDATRATVTLHTD